MEDGKRPRIYIPTWLRWLIAFIIFILLLLWAL